MELTQKIDSGPPPAVEMQGIQGEQQMGLVASDGRYGDVVFQSQWSYGSWRILEIIFLCPQRKMTYVISLSVAGTNVHTVQNLVGGYEA